MESLEERQMQAVKTRETQAAITQLGNHKARDRRRRAWLWATRALGSARTEDNDARGSQRLRVERDRKEAEAASGPRLDLHILRAQLRGRNGRRAPLGATFGHCASEIGGCRPAQHPGGLQHWGSCMVNVPPSDDEALHDERRRVIAAIRRVASEFPVELRRRVTALRAEFGLPVGPATLPPPLIPAPAAEMGGTASPAACTDRTQPDV